MPNSCLRRRRLAAGLACIAWLCLVGCTSARERRTHIEELSATWVSELPEESLAEMTEEIRELGELEPGSTDALASVPLLARQALVSPSAFVRAEALRAAWALMSEMPSEPLVASAVAAPEFNAWMERFQLLDDDEAAADGPEAQELAGRIGSYRFPPSQARFAIDLAAVAAVRAWQRRAGAVQQVFADIAPATIRHALVLVTLQAGDDHVAFVREQALLAARYLHPDTCFKRLTASLSTESDPMLIFAALDSLEAVGRSAGAASVAPLLEYAARSTDAAIRRRAQRILEELAS